MVRIREGAFSCKYNVKLDSYLCSITVPSAAVK